MHVRRALHLHLPMRGTNPACMSEGLFTHIWSCRNQSYSHIRMALSPRLSFPGNWLGASIPRMAFNAYIWSCRNQHYSHIRMAQHSHLTWKEPILSPWQNGLALTPDHGRNQSSHHVRMAHRLITSLWRKPRFGAQQASPWSTQNSLCIMAFSTHQLSIHPSQHTGASLLLSAPYP